MKVKIITLSFSRNILNLYIENNFPCEKYPAEDLVSILSVVCLYICKMTLLESIRRKKTVEEGISYWISNPDLEFLAQEFYKYLYHTGVIPVHCSHNTILGNQFIENKIEIKSKFIMTEMLPPSLEQKQKQLKSNSLKL